MKKGIRINEDNKEKIELAIKEAEGKSTARTINYDIIERSLKLVEEKLNIAKKSMVGIKVECNYHAQVFPSAYEYTPFSTFFWAKYTSAGWSLICVERRICGRHEFVLTLTDTSKEALIKKYERFNQ